MRFGSVCSGIEAASVAWEPLGWEPAWFAEIEPYPSAVLKERFPNVPNYGDFTAMLDPNHEVHSAPPIDLLVGGCPCQDFSVAGLRAGIEGARGHLTLAFLQLARILRPRWLVYENVPGLLTSDGGRAFGAFLGGLEELGYGWSYRTLDAQYVRVEHYERAVPQRRRRVFVVGHLGADWLRPASVLLEPEGSDRDSVPRRTTREEAAAALGRGLEASGLPRAERPDSEHLPVEEGSSGGDGGAGSGGDGVVALGFEPRDYTRDNKTGGAPAATVMVTASAAKAGDAAPTVAYSAHPSATARSPVPTLSFKPGQSEAAGGVFVTEEFAPTLQAQNNGSTAVPAVAYCASSVAGTLDANYGKGPSERGGVEREVIALQDVRDVQKAQNGRGWNADGAAYTLDTHATQGVAHIEAVSHTVAAKRAKGYGGYAGQNECDNCILEEHAPRETPAEDEVFFIAEDADEVAVMVAALFARGDEPPQVRAFYSSNGVVHELDGVMATLDAARESRGTNQQRFLLTPAADPYVPPVASTLSSRDYKGPSCGRDGVTGNPVAPTNMAVRRLTPTECERLMGFPPAEMRVSIGTWYDPESSDARVVLKSHKSRAGVWLAEGEGSRPSASCAEASLSTPRAEYAEPVVLNVLLQSDEWEVRTSRAGRCLLRVKSAELRALSRPLTQVESSAQTLALGVLALESAALLGREASHLLTMPSTVAESGNPCAVRFGDEMGESAADAPTAHKNAKGMSTTSSPEPSASKVASMWTTLCCSAVRAIAGYTQTTTRKDSFEVEVVVHRGWTAIPWRNKSVSECPDGPRYKALGNSMAVNCMRFIGERIALIDAVFSELEAASEADE